jgi:predicted acetyltransferase
MPAPRARSRKKQGPSVSVRQARKKDLDRLLEIHTTAFPDPRSVEPRRRVFLANKHGGFEHLHVAERAGEIVGHAFLFPLEVWVSGARAQAAGIASVGVALEARGSGVARALLSELHGEAAKMGAAFTLLYAFRQGFYAEAGYAPVSTHRVLTLSPRAIPEEWVKAAPGVVRRMVGRDAAEVARVYDEAARRATGLMVRSARLWESYLLDEARQWLVVEHQGSLTGYVCFTLHQTEGHARVRAEVHELVAEADPARRRLFGTLRRLSDQVGDLTVTLAADDPIDWAFVDADRDRAGTEEIEHAIGVVSCGPMVRATSASRLAGARGYLHPGMLNVKVPGEAGFALEVTEGRARVTRSRKAPTLQVSSQVFASIAVGGLSVHDAMRLGWLPGNKPDALAVAASLFEQRAFFTLDAF